MQVLAVLQQKGGVGKTTISTCLAVEAEAQGKSTAIIDLDPQATVSFWADSREANTPAVTSVQAVRIPAMLESLREAGADLVILDGAAVARDIAHTAAKAADFVLLPTKSSAFDLHSMMQTIELVRDLGKPFAVVQNFVAPQGDDTRNAERAAEDAGLVMCPVTLGNRKAFFRAQAEGLTVQEFEPNGKGANEIKRLYRYVIEQLTEQTQEVAA